MGLTDTDRTYIFEEGARIEAEDRRRWDEMSDGAKSRFREPVINPLLSPEEKARWLTGGGKTSVGHVCGTIAFDMNCKLHAEKVLREFLGEEDFEQIRHHGGAVRAALKLARERGFDDWA